MKIVKLKESDIYNIAKRIISEQEKNDVIDISSSFELGKYEDKDNSILSKLNEYKKLLNDINSITVIAGESLVTNPGGLKKGDLAQKRGETVRNILRKIAPNLDVEIKVAVGKTPYRGPEDLKDDNLRKKYNEEQFVKLQFNDECKNIEKRTPNKNKPPFRNIVYKGKKHNQFDLSINDKPSRPYIVKDGKIKTQSHFSVSTDTNKRLDHLETELAIKHYLYSNDEGFKGIEFNNYVENNYGGSSNLVNILLNKTRITDYLDDVKKFFRSITTEDMLTNDEFKKVHTLIMSTKPGDVYGSRLNTAIKPFFDKVFSKSPVIKAESPVIKDVSMEGVSEVGAFTPVIGGGVGYLFKC